MFFLTEPHPCSYLPNRISSTQFVEPAVTTMPLYSQLIDHGFRRSGEYVYTPACQSCQSCIAIRLAVEKFRPNRSQKRTIKKNDHLEMTVVKPEFKQEYYTLYIKYTQARHTDGGMDKATEEEFMKSMVSRWCKTWFVEIRDNQQLLAVAVIDELSFGLSAVYTFFDPDLRQNHLGVYGVLWSIEWVKKLNLPYYYLGYWVGGCEKMSYKNNYTPLEAYINHEWITFDSSLALEEYIQV
ncbi:MAG: arginyltransferase [Methylococcales bacterium]|nr:arginyltransferase [Methylococcales bacterium]MBT7409357.1 arginyltransferase [Methylococcales bacterium]